MLMNVFDITDVFIITDVDECKLVTCSQICINTPGSFRCLQVGVAPIPQGKLSQSGASYPCHENFRLRIFHRHQFETFTAYGWTS